MCFQSFVSTLACVGIRPKIDRFLAELTIFRVLRVSIISCRLSFRADNRVLLHGDLVCFHGVGKASSKTNDLQYIHCLIPKFHAFRSKDSLVISKIIN